jgi:hypothetical protein
MEHPAVLWKKYSQAISRNDLELAKQILALIQGYKGESITSRLGCSSCRKRFR